MVDLTQLLAPLTGTATGLVAWAGKHQVRRIDKLEEAASKLDARMDNLQTKEDAQRDRDELRHDITGNFKVLDEKMTRVLLHLAGDK